MSLPAPTGHHFGWKPLLDLNGYTGSILIALFFTILSPIVLIQIGLASVPGVLAIIGLIVFAPLLVSTAIPYVSLRGPVLSITPDGLLDRRTLKKRLDWSAISSISFTDNAKNSLHVSVRPGRARALDKKRLSHFLQNLGAGADGIHIVLSGLDLEGIDVFELCQEFMVDDESNQAAIAEHTLQAHMSGGVTRDVEALARGLENAMLWHPIYEKTASHDLHVMTDEKGRKLVCAFTRHEICSEEFPQLYPAGQYMPEFLAFLEARNVDILHIAAPSGRTYEFPRASLAKLRQALERV